MKYSLLLSFVFFSVQIPLGFSQPVPSPEEHLGFHVGADYKLAGWDQITHYFQRLDTHSEKIQVLELGKTTRRNPLIMAVISSAENLQYIDKYKRIIQQLANPREITVDRALQLSKEGKVFVLVTCSNHAHEVGPAQMSMELAYKLITEENEKTQYILNNVVFLLVPCLNPDGLITMKEWNDTNLGTPYEGRNRPPYLYNAYAGGDINRDAFMLTQVESRLITKVLYKDWLPQVYNDQHQMVNYNIRFFVPPFIDPPNPNVDPIVWNGIGLFGAHIAYDMEAAGHSGVASNAFFDGWFQGCFHATSRHHNVIGLLTEAAVVNLTSPIFQKISDLRGRPRGLPEYRQYMNHLNPWKGGWWRLRDVVDYYLTATTSLLDAAAKYRESILLNYSNMARSAIEKGKQEPPYAYLVPPDQFDRSSAFSMVETLMVGGVKVHQASAGFEADNTFYPKGTYVILMSQPYRAYAKDLLEKQAYPDLPLYKGGPPARPYDVTSWTLPLQMGVEAIEIKAPFEAILEQLPSFRVPESSISEDGQYFVVDYRTLNSVKLINRLVKKKYRIYLSNASLTVQGKTLPAGTVLIPIQRDISGVIKSSIGNLSLHVSAVNRMSGLQGYAIQPFRIGVYRPWFESEAEGWSRWVLEQHFFEYTNIYNTEMRRGALREKFDVIYLPDIEAKRIFEGREKGYYPPQYVQGIQSAGINSLRTFVEEGGTLVAMNRSSQLLINNFPIPVKNILNDTKPEDFFCPGSILQIDVKTDAFLGFGMRAQSSAFFMNSSAYAIDSSCDESVMVAHYPEKGILQSGWINGEKTISGNGAVLDVPFGKGHMILIGFDAIHRAQSCNTFKLLFNAFYFSTAKLTEIP